MEEFSRPESEFEAHWLHLYYNYCELTASLGVKLAHNEKYHSLTSYVKHLCKIQISLSPRSLVIYIYYSWWLLKKETIPMFRIIIMMKTTYLQWFLHSQIHFKWISKMIPWIILKWSIKNWIFLRWILFFELKDSIKDSLKDFHVDLVKDFHVDLVKDFMKNL